MTLAGEYEPEPKRRFFRCSDRLCGNLDCANCRPEITEEEPQESET